MDVILALNSLRLDEAVLAFSYVLILTCVGMAFSVWGQR